MPKDKKIKDNLDQDLDINLWDLGFWPAMLEDEEVVDEELEDGEEDEEEMIDFLTFPDDDEEVLEDEEVVDEVSEAIEEPAEKTFEEVSEDTEDPTKIVEEKIEEPITEEKTADEIAPEEWEEKSTDQVLDEAAKLIEDLSNLLWEDNEWIQDKMDEIKETSDRAVDAESVTDYKDLLNEYATKFEELSDMLMDKDIKVEQLSREVDKLRKMLDDATHTVDEMDFKTIRNKVVLDIIDENPQLKAFVRIKWAYDGGDHSSKEMLVDELSDMVKDVTGIDLKSMLVTKAKEDKNMAIDAEDIEAPIVTKQGKELDGIMPWF